MLQFILFVPIFSTQDFNGDGYRDLAIGAPYDDFDVDRFDSGSVTVVSGGPGLPAPPGVQRWTQETLGVLGDAARTDEFGLALSFGDYNGDGYDDLAIGIPSDELPGLVGAGSVQVLYSSSTGLGAAGNQLWSQDAPGLGSVAEDYDAFGQVLASGDFNGDSYTDLALGVPYEDEAGGYDAGAVQVLYGSAAGLGSAGSQYWTQDSPGIADQAETPDRFGWALAAGDFNADGIADLAIGVPYESVGSLQEAGALHLLYGGPGGLSAASSQFWTQESAGIPGVAETHERFGSALAAGDFNGDGADDLAAGVPADHADPTSAFGGSVNLLYGSLSGLSATGAQLWSQNSPGVADDTEGSDQFGYALAAGDLDGDGLADLAVGAPGEGFGIRPKVGAVTVLFGRSSGLSAAGSLFLQQGKAAIPESNGVYDAFGQALAVLDLDGDGRAELAIGVPGESGASRAYGAVTLLSGSRAHPISLTEDTPGIPDTSAAGDQFGFSFAH